jgi:hypothetical protein
VKYLSERRNRGDKIHVLYSYATIRSTNRFSNVAMTLLSQLYTDWGDLPEDLRFRLAAISAAQEHPPTESVTSLLGLALRRTSETVFIVTDGLDEFPKPEQKLFLDFITWLQSDGSATGTHIIVASRVISEVYRFSGQFVVPVINISHQTSSDINILIANGLDQLELLDQMVDLKEELTQYLAAHADGRYVQLGALHRPSKLTMSSILWVNHALRCVAERVARGFSNKAELVEVLRELPTNLEDQYQFTLERIPVKRWSEAMNILAWPTFTFRPLSCQEFVEVVKLNGLDSSIGLSPAKANTRANQIVESLFGMVVVRQDQVELGHRTVRDYLLHRRHPVALDPCHGHTQILSACFDTLLEELDVKRPAFFNYAAEFWMRHFEELRRLQNLSDSLHASIGQALNKLFDVDHPQYFLRWLRRYDPLNPEAGRQPEKRLKDFPSQEEYMNLARVSK